MSLWVRNFNNTVKDGSSLLYNVSHLSGDLKELDWNIWRLLHSHVWHLVLWSFKEPGPNIAVSPQATLCIFMWSLKVLSIFSMVSSKYSYFLSVISGHQDMYIKRDSQIEATSHFMTYNCKSLRHIHACHILSKS